MGGGERGGRLVCSLILRDFRGGGRGGVSGGMRLSWG